MLLSDIDPDARSDNWHLVMPGGDHLTLGPAAIALLIEMKPTRWIGRALGWLRADWLVGVFVSLFDWLRPRLGRFVKDAPGPHRYP